ncbi:MAG: sporulation protein [candidate division Zixibacteria bacterium]|nr:sporulation protein [candidate division Zixibacteria bacterium]MCP4703020.1 sporulation protein [candidate division Zixibacteria bacterium]
MSENKVSEILKDIVGELKNIATSQTVVGDPITVNEKTVVPVVKISVGFGAGGGQGAKGDQSGFGGGGGGAAKIEPSAFIIMDQKKISLLSAKPGKLDALVEAVPGLFGKIKDIRDSLKKDEPKANNEDTKENGEDGKPGYESDWC